MNWSSFWCGSSKPGKQRNYVKNAPLHVKTVLLGSRVSDEVAKISKSRSLRVRKGDTVKVMRGQYKGKSGKVERVDVSRQKVFIVGVDFAKKDGGRSLYPVHASKVLITALEGSDKRRLQGGQK